MQQNRLRYTTPNSRDQDSGFDCVLNQSAVVLRLSSSMTRRLVNATLSAESRSTTRAISFMEISFSKTDARLRADGECVVNVLVVSGFNPGLLMNAVHSLAILVGVEVRFSLSANLQWREMSSELPELFRR